MAVKSYIPAILSHTWLVLRILVIRLALRVWRTFSPSIDALLNRLSLSPGVPVSNPCISYWATPPSHIAQHGSDPDSTLPDVADVVIIGSGITGTAFARTLLDHDAIYGVKEKPLRVVMLEARDACSGATSRNGGHIAPVLDYSELKKSHGAAAARQIIRFRLDHLSELLEAARQENLLQESQCREVDTFDVFYDKGLYSSVKSQLRLFKKDMPVEGADLVEYEGAEAFEKLQLSPRTVGVIASHAGVIHPYRFVTGILSRLLQSYPSHFHLFTHTPCTAISSPCQPTKLYTISTPRGTLRTTHIVHATNAWASHLLPPMRGKIVPVKAHMSAQRPWKVSSATEPSGEDHWTGARSFAFYPSTTEATLDYLTQQPVAPSASDLTSSATPSSSIYPPPAAELMFGGGLTQGGRDIDEFIEQIGNVDDSKWASTASNYLSEALEGYFVKEKGDVEKDMASDQGEVDAGGVNGRMKAVWSGILGFSVDDMPWVGRVPEKISGRSFHTSEGVANGDVGDAAGIRETSLGPSNPALRESSTPDSRLASPGEWIAAGYSGEGMVHAWLCGKALAFMVLGLDNTSPSVSGSSGSSHDTRQQGERGCDRLRAWFPDTFRVTEERWKQATLEDLFASHM